VPQEGTAALLTRISADGPGVSEEALRRLPMPTLVIGHEADAIHPLADAKRLASLISHARFVAITPKAVDKAAYVNDFKAALAAFIKEIRNG